MNRGLMFYVPARAAAIQLSKEQGECGWFLASYMPGITLYLTEPCLTWCADHNLLGLHKTRIGVGSSYVLTDKLVLGPLMNNSDAASDGRAAAFIETFATDVANGLRWILQTYGTTDLLRERDLGGKGLAIAKSLNRHQPLASHVPVKLVTRLKDTSGCDQMVGCFDSEQPLHVERSATDGTVQEGRHNAQSLNLGTASIREFCHGDARPLARDLYALRPDESKRLLGLLRKDNKHIGTNACPNGETPRLPYQVLWSPISSCAGTPARAPNTPNQMFTCDTAVRFRPIPSEVSNKSLLALDRAARVHEPRPLTDTTELENGVKRRRPLTDSEL